MASGDAGEKKASGNHEDGKAATGNGANFVEQAEHSWEPKWPPV